MASRFTYAVAQGEAAGRFLAWRQTSAAGLIRLLRNAQADCRRESWSAKGGPLEAERTLAAELLHLLTRPGWRAPETKEEARLREQAKEQLAYLDDAREFIEAAIELEQDEKIQRAEGQELSDDVRYRRRQLQMALPGRI